MIVSVLVLLSSAAIASAATTCNLDHIYDPHSVTTWDLFDGRHIDFNYNDTSPHSAKGLPSVPGCPKNVDGKRWVYYGSTLSKGCYVADYRGPCEQDQHIFVEPGSLVGYCNCDCLRSVEMESTNRYIFCSPRHNNLQFVFDQEVKRCYVIFDQGPCKLNEWFVPIDKTGKSYSASPGSLMKCEERKCPQGKLGVKEDGKVKCVNMEITGADSGASTAGQNACNGEKTSGNNECGEKFEFNQP